MAAGTRWLTQYEKDLLRPLIEANVDKTDDGHWLWLGQLNDGGYGVLFGIGVHRLAYLAWIGPIGHGMHIDHVCRQPRCCKPEDKVHLEQVTPEENNRRAMEYVQKSPDEHVHHAAKRWCTHGHEFTPENTGHEAKRKRRYCKACRRADTQRRRRKTQQPRGDQWHVDEAVFVSLASRYPPRPGEPTITNKEMAELIGISVASLAQWCRRHPEMAGPGPGRRRLRLWPESLVLRLIEAKSNENWSKQRKDDYVIGRRVWVTDPESGERRRSRRVADVGRPPGGASYTWRTDKSTGQPVDQVVKPNRAPSALSI